MCTYIHTYMYTYIHSCTYRVRVGLVLIYLWLFYDYFFILIGASKLHWCIIFYSFAASKLHCWYYFLFLLLIAYCSFEAALYLFFIRSYIKSTCSHLGTHLRPLMTPVRVFLFKSLLVQWVSWFNGFDSQPDGRDTSCCAVEKTSMSAEISFYMLAKK